MTERAEVIIVGGGVMGLSAAFHRAEASVDAFAAQSELGVPSHMPIVEQALELPPVVDVSGLSAERSVTSSAPPELTCV